MNTTHHEVEIQGLEAALIAAEVAEILAGEDNTMIVSDIAQATAEANGVDLTKASDEAQATDEALNQAANQTTEPDTRTYADLIADVTDGDIAAMQVNLAAAFADRASYERTSNPNNDNIQKTLTKVQKGHLAHGISKALKAVGVDPNYLNKSEVAGKRRNVYALEKLQDIIYGAQTGHFKNKINIAVMASLVKLEAAQIAFTGAVAKACASDKMPCEVHLKGLLSRHTVSEATASTQSSSTMTALEDLGVVINNGSQKFPLWSLTNTALTNRLREVVRTKHMSVTA